MAIYRDGLNAFSQNKLDTFHTWVVLYSRSRPGNCNNIPIISQAGEQRRRAGMDIESVERVVGVEREGGSVEPGSQLDVAGDSGCQFLGLIYFFTTHRGRVEGAM